jgi:putative PIN family toxin of toxin-antitoxin system
MKINKLKIVLDTNVFLVSISPKFKYYWIYEKLQNGDYDLLISNEIVAEYAEKINEKFGISLVRASLDFMLLFPNVYEVNPYYKWELITVDRDDNKFVDCAIVGNADYIITHDKHFNVLKTIEFPKVKILTIDEFYQLLLNNK